MYKGAGTPANVTSSSVSTTTVAAPLVVYTAPPLMRENLKSCLHKKQLQRVSYLYIIAYDNGQS